jgi:hypothetical protein
MRHEFFNMPRRLVLAIALLSHCMMQRAPATALITAAGFAHGLTTIELRTLSAGAVRLPAVTGAAHASRRATPSAIEQPKELLHPTPPARSAGQRSARQA